MAVSLLVVRSRLAARFLRMSAAMVGKTRGKSAKVDTRRFRAFFGVTPKICARVWLLLEPNCPSRAMPKHLLWALFFLKVYSNEHVSSVSASADEKTVRKWQWIFVKLMAGLRIVSFF